MSGSHKNTVEQFTQTINNRHVNHLDNVLDNNVEKKDNTKTVFSNIQEAREYYSMEHEANPSAQWKIIDFKQDDSNKNTAQATISYNNHTYNTTYKFNSDGKIQNIDSHLQQQ
ncbi:unnamed protein product [Adineta steineri]|nr:unnamed protein product [Adineta steineri]CAF3711490.1 unnamed protein product [Adineta steineri]